MSSENILIIRQTPSIEEFNNVLLYGLRRKLAIIFLSTCEVHYQGRSRSYLEPGDRLIIIKEDRSVLIHRTKGYKPVNWQPSGAQISVRNKDNKAIITCIRASPREKIRIIVHKVHVILVAKLTDMGKFHMHMTEEEMKHILFRNLQLIIEDGMRGITMEKEIGSGKIDIFARDARGNYVIIELKKGRASERDVLQLNRYVTELRATNPNIRGILVSPSISTKALDLIRNLNLEYKKTSFRDLEKYLK